MDSLMVEDDQEPANVAPVPPPHAPPPPSSHADDSKKKKRRRLEEDTGPAPVPEELPERKRKPGSGRGRKSDAVPHSAPPSLLGSAHAHPLGSPLIRQSRVSAVPLPKRAGQFEYALAEDRIPEPPELTPVQQAQRDRVRYTPQLPFDEHDFDVGRLHSDYSLDSGSSDREFQDLDITASVEKLSVGGTALYLPLTMMQLEDWSDVFSLEVWNHILTNEDRIALLEFLPAEATSEDTKTTIERLLTGRAFRGLSPVQIFHANARAGRYQPHVAKYLRRIRSLRHNEDIEMMRAHHNNLILRARDAAYHYNLKAQIAMAAAKKDPGAIIPHTLTPASLPTAARPSVRQYMQQQIGIAQTRQTFIEQELVKRLDMDQLHAIGITNDELINKIKLQHSRTLANRSRLESRPATQLHHVHAAQGRGRGRLSSARRGVYGLDGEADGAHGPQTTTDAPGSSAAALLAFHRPHGTPMDDIIAPPPRRNFLTLSSKGRVRGPSNTMLGVFKKDLKIFVPIFDILWRGDSTNPDQAQPFNPSLGVPLAEIVQTVENKLLANTLAASVPVPPPFTLHSYVEDGLRYLAGELEETPSGGPAIKLTTFDRDLQRWKWIGPVDTPTLTPLLLVYEDTYFDQHVKLKIRNYAASSTGITKTGKVNITIMMPTTEQIDMFQEEERERFQSAHEPYFYTTAVRNPRDIPGRHIVAPAVRGLTGNILTSQKARDHFLLVPDRPPNVTLLCLVRDAAARLPNGEGTRADLCLLVRHSQYIVPEASDVQVNSRVSAALDRLHYETDPCVKYDSDKKLWIYLHKDRTSADFDQAEFTDAADRSANPAEGHEDHH